MEQSVSEIEVLGTTNVPQQPEDTGSSDTQKPVTEIVPLEKDSPFSGLPIAETIEGLATTKSRSLGGEIGARLLSASFYQISKDLQDSRQELKDTREDLKKTTKDLYSVKEENAVLNERLGTQSREGRLRNLLIAFGTTLIFIRIELYRKDIDKLAYIVGGFGGLLFLFGWLSKQGGGR